jgi:hypothetical protein
LEDKLLLNQNWGKDLLSNSHFLSMKIYRMDF